MFFKVVLVSLMIGASWQISCPPNYQYEPGVNSPQGSCIGQPSQERDTLDVNEGICRSSGGHLIKINNAFDNSVVQAWFRRVFPETSVGQIGLRKNGSDWFWTDGSPVTYSFWGSSSGGDCALMMSHEGNQPYWYAYPCEQKFFGLCQNPVSACPSGWAYFQQTNKCYYYGRNATLDQAKQYCVSKGGNVASIHSAAENLFVRDLISSDKCWSAYYGSGLYDTQAILGGYIYAQNSGVWWDNTPFDYFPDNVCYNSPPSLTPIILIDSAPHPCSSCDGYQGGWSASYYNFTSTYNYPGYICKAPPLPTL